MFENEFASSVNICPEHDNSEPVLLNNKDI